MPEQQTKAGPVGFDGDEDIDDGDFEIGTADLGIEQDDDLMDDVDLGFDGTEEAADQQQSGGPSGSGSSSGSDDDPQLADAINNGIARASVYGLPDHEKEDLQTEFREIAEAFHVGHFGNEVAQEYLARDLDDIPPEIGLAAATVAFAAVVLHKRPDGELIVRRARWKFHDAKQRYTEDDQPAADADAEAAESTEDTEDSD